MTAFWCRGTQRGHLTPPNVDGPDPARPAGVRRHHLRHQPRGRHRGRAAATRAAPGSRRSWTSPCSAAGCGRWATRSRCRCTWTAAGWRRRPGVHGAPTNPLSGLYRTADDRYLSLVMLQPSKFWADVCRHIDRPDLADDPRFAPAERPGRERRRGGQDPAGGDRPPSPGRVDRALRHAGRAVGPGPGHSAGRFGRTGPGQRVHPAGRRPRTGLQPGAVRRDRPGPEPRPPSSPRRPSRSCWNSAWAGTASPR